MKNENMKLSTRFPPEGEQLQTISFCFMLVHVLSSMSFEFVYTYLIILISNSSVSVRGIKGIDLSSQDLVVVSSIPS